MADLGYKTCTVCGEDKSLEDFYRRAKSRDGRMSRCKTCDNAKKKAWTHANMDRHEEFTNRWKKNNPEAQAAIHQRARQRQLEKDPKFAVKAVKRHRERHPEKDRARRAVQRGVREERLIKPDFCQNCKQLTNAHDLHGHHEDYSKPLEIEWLCRSCHWDKHSDEH